MHNERHKTTVHLQTFSLTIELASATHVMCCTIRNQSGVVAEQIFIDLLAK